MRSFIVFAICLVMAAIVMQQSEAGHSLKLKRLIKYGLIAKALTGKKIPLPLPLPLPIPIFKENIHHTPYPVNHHTHAEIGYGLQHGHGYGGGFGGGYGGGYGGGHGGGYGGGYGGGFGGDFGGDFGGGYGW
ncbi:uncharacterized protein TNIN_438561 [Trichonephila inaurata madagascariensis]|uniref:Uncharacterized protein n=1 Tax=Trichonephila inaurata madagascariensis TaxID=2747483 RepID=A0A8X7CLR0_9ARAC|nr:uncharacterized protein TNIN_438561 [Trichonephila inaurata madagascariensis]